MPYDHNKKAGNQGDAVKHAALIAAADALITENNGTFKYADTFAGYPYNPLRADGEWKNGIDALWRSGRKPATSAVKFWRELWWCRVGLRGSVYPGSSTFILKLCQEKKRPFFARLWDTSPAVVAQLTNAYKNDEAEIYPRPAELDDLAGTKINLLLIDPPGLQTSEKLEYPKLTDLLRFFGVVENAILWFPMTASGEGALEAKTSRKARAVCLDSGLWVTSVRWTSGAHVCGCQLAYRLRPTACKKLQEAVDDVAALMGWRPDLIKHEKPTRGPSEERPPGTPPDSGRPGDVGIPCLCGCGNTTMHGSFYMSGHDARLKGYVIKVNKGKIDASVLRAGIDYGAITVHGEGIYQLLDVAKIREIKNWGR